MAVSATIAGSILLARAFENYGDRIGHGRGRATMLSPELLYSCPWVSNLLTP
jgi:hypothetical protein